MQFSLAKNFAWMILNIDSYEEYQYSGDVLHQVDWTTAIKMSQAICFLFNWLLKLFLYYPAPATFSIIFKSDELIG